MPLAQGLPCPQLIFPYKTWFFGNLFEFFSGRNQYLPTFRIQILPNSFHAHQDISNNTKGTFPIPPKIFTYNLIQFSVKKSFSIQELFAPLKSKRHETKLMHHLSSPRAFQREQEHNLKHPGWVDLHQYKQNKLTFA